MSYILNALRKSEQERLARQADAVTGRILDNQPQPRFKSNRLTILLIICNLLVVSILFWYIQKKTELPLAAENLKTKAPVRNQPDQGSLQATNSAPATPSVMQKSGPAAPSIAELAASKKTPATPLPTVSRIVKKNPAPAPAQIKPVMEKKSIADAPKTLAETGENNTIPFLSELPAEFRNTVPELKINVFVYAKQPAERFVMIDMVKYTVGQRIKDSVALKEIRADSLVVEYNDRLFRIERP
jgi:general secretion pathway protein B